MRYIVAVRTGRYVGSDLTPLGQAETHTLAAALVAKFGDCKPLVLASSAPSGQQTGQIIADSFGVQLEVLDELKTEGYTGDSNRLVSAVSAVRERMEGHDIIIAVTHYLTTAVIPWKLYRETSGVSVRLTQEAQYSCAHIVDFETGEVIENFH